MDARELVAVAVARDRPRTGRQNMITAFRRERDLESTSNSRPFPLGEPSSPSVSETLKIAFWLEIPTPTLWFWYGHTLVVVDGDGGVGEWLCDQL